MTTSSTSSLPLATSTTSNLPSATSTTSNLPPTTSTTSNLPPTTSLTSQLPSTTSLTSHLLPSISTARASNINEAYLFVVPVIGEENLLIEAEIEELDDVTINEEVEGNVNLEPGKRFDTIEECVDFYSVYAEKGETKKDASSRKMFVVRASTMRLGATKAHNLYSKMKGGTQYVHGTSDDFKNHIRDVNAFIGESDVQMLINKMENRKNFVPNFTFHYLVENSELVAMFWADEVAKCNYKEYDMVFVPFTEKDNHLKCVNFGSGMLLKEDTEAYTWLLKSFMTAHEKQPTMVVTDQDGAMKRAIEAVFTESKHRLCMWHIMQKVPAKVVRNPEDGSVECTCRHFLRYGFLCRHVFCVLKNCNIEIIPERYILRRWRRDLIPPALRRNKNRYGEKDEAIEKLTNEANFVVDECLFLLRKEKEQLKQFVENLENIKKEIQVKVPNLPSQKMGDVIEDIYAIKKPKQNLVNNPQKARNKEETNKHIKTTCLLNPKYIVKLVTIEIAAEQERRTATSATEKEERNSDSTHIADKEQSNTAS
uniref:SWIM-type domain-containing protein n=1 Tax=Tanacetum cinerariifolium TaxID=118510 RepID=A0A6L2LCX3_TANCI|nr:hypothetical protein [Tanacetum cinerariifolium]